MAPTLASGAAGLLAGGAAATAGATGVVASNPQYFQSSIGDDGLAANILTASRDSQPQTIADVARSQPVTARTQNGPLSVPVIAQMAGDSTAGAGRGMINPPSAIADVARASTAPQYDDTFRAANLANNQNQAYREGDPIGDIIRQKMGGPPGGDQPPADGGGSFLQVGAQSGSQPPQAPISFATYGGGTESTKAYRTDGTTTDLRPGMMSGQGLPADVQAFNQQSAQAGMDSQQPVSVIRNLTQTVALPNAGAAQATGRMQEVPTSVADGGPNAVKNFQSAQTQDAINRADPTAAGVRAKVAESMGDPNMASNGAAPAGTTAAAGAGLIGDDFIKGLPQARGNLVKMIGEGQVPVTPQLLTKNPGLLSQVGQAYPDFNQQDYNARNKLKTSFVNGLDAENIKSLNTAVTHLDLLNGHMNDMNNGSFPWLNSALNATERAGGVAKIQGALRNVGTDVNGVAGELAKVFRSTGMSESEINDWKKNFSTDSTPAEQKAAVESALHMMQGRAEALQQKWTSGMGPKAAAPTIFAKDKQEIIDRLTGKAPDVPGTTPAVGTGKQPAAASVPSIPPAAIAYLQANPQTKGHFEARFGQGSADSILVPKKYADGGLIDDEPMAQAGQSDFVPAGSGFDSRKANAYLAKDDPRHDMINQIMSLSTVDERNAAAKSMGFGLAGNDSAGNNRVLNDNGSLGQILNRPDGIAPPTQIGDQAMRDVSGLTGVPQTPPAIAAPPAAPRDSGSTPSILSGAGGIDSGSTVRDLMSQSAFKFANGGLIGNSRMSSAIRALAFEKSGQRS